MASEVLDQRFLSIPRKTLYFSLVLHLSLPFLFTGANVFEISPFKKKKSNKEKRLYQSYVQVDVVALPEQVGLKNKFVDSSLPIVKKPRIATKKEFTTPAEEKAMVLAKQKAAKRRKEKARQKKLAAEKAKKEAARKKKEQEEARKKAVADLQRRIEQEKAIKELDKGSGKSRAQIAGNILSEGTSTQGKSGGKGRDRYVNLVQSAIGKNFNVFPWLRNKGLESEVAIFLHKDGRIKTRNIVKPSGDARFDSAVLQAVDETRKLPLPQNEEVLTEVLDEGIVINFK